MFTRRPIAPALVGVAFILSSFPAMHSQDVIRSGPWKLFQQEHPSLEYVEIPAPFVVRDIGGTIYYAEDEPLQGATFQIGLGNGLVFGTDSDSKGSFQLRSPRFFGPFLRFSAMRPGTYPFKVTKDGFHSTTGTIVVSPKAPKKASITIQLHVAE
jgi:hypothetical protein